MKRVKAHAHTLPVPQDAMQADEAVQRIGQAQRDLALIQAALDEKLAHAKAEAEAQAKPLAETIERLTAGLQIWATAHRDSLTQHGKTKTVPMPSGEIAWRIRPPAVSLSNVKALVEALLAEKTLGRFLRTKHQPDKEAMLKEPAVAATLPGVTLKTGIEDFVVTPAAAPLAASAKG